MTTITHAQHAAALAAAQDAPDAAAALRAIADAWGVTLPEPEPEYSEEMLKLAREIAATAYEDHGWINDAIHMRKGSGDDLPGLKATLAGLQFAAEKAREQEGCTFGHLIDRHVFLTSIGAGHAR